MIIGQFREICSTFFTCLTVTIHTCNIVLIYVTHAPKWAMIMLLLITKYMIVVLAVTAASSAAALENCCRCFCFIGLKVSDKSFRLLSNGQRRWQTGIL